MRLEAEQVCPAFWIPALTKKGNAASRSASLNTIWGDFPPSSKVTGTTFWAAAYQAMDVKRGSRQCMVLRHLKP